MKLAGVGPAQGPVDRESMKLRWTRPALAAKIWFEGQNYIARDNPTQLERSRNSGLLQPLL